MKKCITCKQDLTPENAFKDTRLAAGLSQYCKECSKKQSKIRRERAKEYKDIVEELVYGNDVVHLMERAKRLLKSVGKR